MPTFLSPSQVETQYLQILKSIKPSLNINDQNSDFVIRGKATTGLASGIYGDQQKVNNDTYIKSARPEALLLFGEDYNFPRQPSTKAQSLGIQLSGVDGTVVGPGDITFLYIPTNVIYTNTTGGTISAGVLTVNIQCSITGQIGNVASPDSLSVISPPSGVGPIATVLTSIADGADIESIDSYRGRLLNRRQSPPAGGNENDYYNFAFAADPSVRSASVRRFGRGLGTVDVYITTGTSDVDTAVTNGSAVVRIPSGLVLASVQSYYDNVVPLTDCAHVYSPTEILINVTVKVVLAAGLTMSSIPSGQYNPINLTVSQLIEREVSRAIYKVSVGGRKISNSLVGYVTASEIEESLDKWLSSQIDVNSGLAIGLIPILSDRQIQPLDAPNINKALVSNQVTAPGTITVIEGV